MPHHATVEQHLARRNQRHSAPLRRIVKLQRQPANTAMPCLRGWRFMRAPECALGVTTAVHSRLRALPHQWRPRQSRGLPRRRKSKHKGGSSGCGWDPRTLRHFERRLIALLRVSRCLREQILYYLKPMALIHEECLLDRISHAGLYSPMWMHYLASAHSMLQFLRACVHRCIPCIT